MLLEYNEQKMSETAIVLESAQEELDDISYKISKIVGFIMESDLSLETVREEMRQLESRKRFLEAQIKDITTKNSTTFLSEETIIDLINKTGESLSTRDIRECRLFLHSYIDKVVSYRERVEIFFRVLAPDNADDIFTQVKSEERTRTLREEYSRIE
jgi:hypothetical protein